MPKARAIVLIAGLIVARPAYAAPQEAPRHHTAGDPLEGLNRQFFSAHLKLDKALFRPAAFGYKAVVPKPARSGLRNFFRNLSEPVVLLNDLLQLKFKRAGETFSRFFINSVLGVAGVFDVAGKDGLKHHNNGFGGTLGRYGVKPGPYLFIPLAGPTTLRDFLGGQADGVVLPLAIGTPFDRFDYQAGRAIVTGLDQRVELDAEYSALISGAADPYATLRSAFLQNREAEIRALKGQDDETSPGVLDTPLDDPAGFTPPADPQPEDPPSGGSGADTPQFDLATDYFF